MSAGFTPGPWVTKSTDATVDDNASHCDDNTVQRINTWMGVGPEGSDHVCAIVVGFEGWEGTGVDRDANLIAAAPQLYEALELFRIYERSIKIDIGTAHKGRGAAASDAMREDDADFRRDLEVAFDKARAAVAKARGEA